MQIEQLNRITDIRTGYTHRNLNTSKDTGGIILLKPTNFNKPYFFVNTPDRLNEGQLNRIETHLLRNNDILITNKGTKIASYLYKDDGQKYVATSSFYVLSLFTEIIIPDYLLWFLNQEKTKNLIRSYLSGSGAQTYTKKSLGCLDIPIPTLEKQNEIVDFFTIINEEKLTIEQLRANTEAIYQLQSKKYLDELL
jgi:restriction endonuclease S subunit